MRGAVTFALAVSASLVAFGPASAQRAPTMGTAAASGAALTSAREVRNGMARDP